jgi:hypothetical protein
VGGTITGTLAVGDVMGDSAPEIFAVTTSPRTLQAINADGTIPPGWPVTHGLSTSWAAPSIGNLDGVGDREVMMVAYTNGTSTNIFAYNGDGSIVTGFPVTYGSLTTYACPVVGDVDSDGDLEIFNAGKLDNPNFYAWDHTGALLPGWPTNAGPNMEGSAIIADFDGDAEREIVVVDNEAPGLVFGYNPDGSAAADFPFTLDGAGAVRLTVHDAQGRLVRVLVDAMLEPGRHEVAWGGVDQGGAPLPSGTYWIELRTAGARAASSVVLVK